MRNTPIGSRPFTLNASALYRTDHDIRRQTVFYTPSTITIDQGQTITGTLYCAPNAKNNRDLDIVVEYQLGQEKPVEIQYKMCVVLSCVLLPFSLVSL
jgi:hypothetical protein